MSTVPAAYVKRLLDHLVQGDWVASPENGFILAPNNPPPQLPEPPGFWKYVNDKIISFNELEPSTLTYFYTEEEDIFADFLPHYSSLTGLFLQNDCKRSSFPKFARKLVEKMAGLTHLMFLDSPPASSTIELCQSISLATNLQLLSIFTEKKKTDGAMAGQVFTETLAVLSQLRSLSVRSPLLTTNTFLLPPTVFQLETLIIDCDKTPCDHPLLQQFPLMTCLANLTLYKVTDSALKILTHRLPPNLSTLMLLTMSLSHETNITESTARALGSALQSLPLVYLYDHMAHMDALFAGILPGLANSCLVELPPCSDLILYLPQLLPVIPRMTSLQRLELYPNIVDNPAFLPLYPTFLEMAKKTTQLLHLVLEIPRFSSIEFLQAFLNCQDLLVLDLHSFHEDIMPPVSWPNLRQLRLTGVRIPDVKTLVLAHPLLEVLKFDCNYSEEALDVLACVPHLHELELHFEKPAMGMKYDVEEFMLSFGELVGTACWRKIQVIGLEVDYDWCVPSPHIVYCKVGKSHETHPQLGRNRVRAKTLVDYHIGSTLFSELMDETPLVFP